MNLRFPAVAVLTLAGCEPTTAPHTVTHPEGVVIASRPLGGRPYGVAISKQGVVYTARLDVDSVSRADLPDTLFHGGVAVGMLPSHVAFNPAGTRAYVANQGSHSVSVVNVTSGVVETTIPLGSNAWNAIVSPDGATLYATTDQGAVYFIATATNTIEATQLLETGDALRGLALDVSGATLYVAGRNSGTIYVINTRTRHVSRKLRIGGTPQRIALSGLGRELYVANEARGLDFIRLPTGPLATLPVGSAYGLALSPDDAQLYVTIPNSGIIHVIDRAGRFLVRSLTVGGRPRTVAFSASGEFAVVANELGSSLHFIH
jgi:YVTN family beta-propeller protein